MNKGPACPNCGRTDESARDALNKAGEDADKAGRASSLGLGWVTSQSSPTLQKGTMIAIFMAIALPIAAAILPRLTR
ncbi:MAG: hypothetical protein JNM28_11055 [Armatimonadetes bacterium]|nr:hypothetical protein [Armatimonadota bacterium]